MIHSLAHSGNFEVDALMQEVHLRYQPGEKPEWILDIPLGGEKGYYCVPNLSDKARAQLENAWLSLSDHVKSAIEGAAQ